MALTRLNNQALTNVTSAGLPSGSVIQVKQKTITASTTPTASFADLTGFSDTITPSSTSSKIMMMVDLGMCYVAGDGSGFGIRLMRGSTVIFDGDARDSSGPHHSYSSSGGHFYWTRTMHYLDSPSSTSQLTYKVQGQLYSSGSTVNLCGNASGNNSTGLLTLMEIAG